jgi:hypothetical protein
MKTAMTISSFVILLLSCISCGLGYDPPKFEEIQVSPDGTKLVHLYSVFFCNSYSNNGGFTRRSGSTSYYVDIYDSKTGNKINKKSYKISNYPNLAAVTNHSIIISSLNKKGSGRNIRIFNIKDGKMTYDQDKLKKINQGLVFDPLRILTNKSGKNGIAIIADDARAYLLDDLSGKATLLSDNSFADGYNKSENFDKLRYLSNDSINFEFSGTTRKKAQLIIKNTLKDNDQINQNTASTSKKLSTIDFIEPYLVSVRSFNNFMKEEAETIKSEENWLVISKSKASDNYETVFTLLDKNNLTQIWETRLSNPLVDLKSEELKIILPDKNSLLIVSDQSINRLNMKSGKWEWNQRLIQKLR